MSAGLGIVNLEEELTFYAQAHSTAGAVSDTDSAPTYAVYEEETDATVLSGSMTKLDDSGTTGFYKLKFPLTSATGFKHGRSYAIRYEGAVSSTTGAAVEQFRVGYAAAILNTTVGSVTSQTVFTLEHGQTLDDGYNDLMICAISATGQMSWRRITDYAGSTKTVTIDSAFGFTIIASHSLSIFPQVSARVLSIADDSITASAIQDAAITAAKLADNAIAAAKIASNAITDAKIATGAFTAAKFASAAITVDKIADGAITAAKIASNAITTAKIADGALTAAKIASSAITEAKIATAAFTAAKFDAAAITADKIATGAISAAKLASDAGNKIADHVLRRSAASARASSDGDTVIFRSLLGGVSKLVNKCGVSGSNLITYEENDSTTFGTQAMTTDANADPITDLDTA